MLCKLGPSSLRDLFFMQTSKFQGEEGGGSQVMCGEGLREAMEKTEIAICADSQDIFRENAL